MHSILQYLFQLFGKNAFGQVIGATCIGALLITVFFLKSGEQGTLSIPVLIGAALGLTAGLILIAPRIFFGLILGLIGLFIVIAPMSFADESEITLIQHAIKFGTGAGLIIMSLFLIASGLKSTVKERPMDDGSRKSNTDHGSSCNR